MADSTDAGVVLAGLSRETTIRRDASGRWSQDGIELEHASLVRAFDSWVDVAEDGRYCLRNAINWAYVAIDGPAFFVREARRQGTEVRLRLSGDLEEALDPSTLRIGPDGALYCDVRPARLPARFDRHAAFGLEALLGEDGQGVYLEVAGARFRPPRVEDPLARRRAGP